MAWTDVVLSTDESITKIESGVVSLALPLYANDTIQDCVKEEDKTVLKVTDKYYDILKIGMIIKSQNEHANYKIFVKDDDSKKIYVSPNIKDCSKWIGSNYFYYTQETKIKEAKLQLGIKLKKVLQKSKFAEYFDKDENVLDYISVNDELKLASDYFVLALIYESLMQTQNSSFELKFNYYYKKFSDLFADALDLIDLDLDLDGKADVKSANITKTVFLKK